MQLATLTEISNVLPHFNSDKIILGKGLSIQLNPTLDKLDDSEVKETNNNYRNEILGCCENVNLVDTHGIKNPDINILHEIMTL